MSTTPDKTRVADAPRLNWVDRYAPEAAKPWLRLARADRPIGTWLLLLPCWWGMALAVGADGVPPSFATLLLYFLYFAVGSLVMRGAGCTWNDITDREFDAEVERTRSRPIPSGQVSVSGALVFLILQCLVGLLILIQFNPFTIVLCASSLVLVGAYPFMKRITWWPQVWLGLTINWGILAGWSAIAGGLSAAPVLLYGGAVFWTIGYDTIYAHQDKEDDLLVGVKSSAIKLGERSRFWVGVCYGALIGLAGLAGLMVGLGPLFYIGLAGAAFHLIRQTQQLDINDPDLCLRLFKSNRNTGFVMMFAILGGHLI